jgi:hypothetical protein
LDVNDYASGPLIALVTLATCTRGTLETLIALVAFSSLEALTACTRGTLETLIPASALEALIALNSRG